jgi:hypothetical protein
MKTKQTAMQELIKEMESLKTNKPYVNPQNALRDCLSLAYLKIGMEKEQVIDAVDSIEIVNRRYYKDGTFGDDKVGKEIQVTGREYIGLSVTGELYYSETYGGEQ